MIVRSGKNDDLVRKVELIEANPMYAKVRYLDGRESNVSLKDLARCPGSDHTGGSQTGDYTGGRSQTGDCTDGRRMARPYQEVNLVVTLT